MAFVYFIRFGKMKKLRVLYTIPNFDTAGSGKALLNLALGLNKNQFEPHILCLNENGAFFETVKQSGIPIHIFDYLPQERPLLNMLHNCWKVSRKLKEINPDIIHSFNYSSNYTEALSARMAGIQWTFTKKNMSWGGFSANSWKIRSFLAKKIIVQNTDMQKQFYPNSSKTTLISRGVVLEKFKADLPLPIVKEKMYTQPEQRVLICVANFVPVKGIETLIEAFTHVQEKHAGWVLWLVGDTQNDYGKMLQEKVSESNMSHKIIFSGKQLDVKSFLNHAELFVLPTLDKGEGSPVALLEAMANGKAVLGSEVPGIKDQLHDFPAHLFKPKDVEDLASKLDNYMAMDKNDLRELGQKFNFLVATNYSIFLEIEKHEKFYLSLR